MSRFAKFSLILSLASSAFSVAWAQTGANSLSDNKVHPTEGIGADSKGGWEEDGGKISADLWLLLDQIGQFANKESGQLHLPKDPDMEDVKVVDGHRWVEVVAEVRPGTRRIDIVGSTTGVKWIDSVGDFAFLEVDVAQIRRVSGNRRVLSLSLENRFEGMPPLIPDVPAKPALPHKGGASWVPNPVPGTFDQQGLTGKGVIVTVIDSGIDWKHPDFIDASGKSRILELWDLSDDSFATKGIGSAPPVAGLGGTLYTSAQINEALAGHGVVNSKDTVGHGTACAGMAAGNGRAKVTGMPAGIYKGVAPGADLIICKVTDDKGHYRHEEEVAKWAIEEAKKFHEPVVINLSCGSQASAHDGLDKDEKVIDSIVGHGIPGAAICVAAGNERPFGLHASGFFNKAEAGVQSNASPKILDMQRDGYLVGVFDNRDDWGLNITCADSDMFSKDKSGKAMSWKLYWDGQKIQSKYEASDGSETDTPEEMSKLYETEADGATRKLNLLLPASNYFITPFGGETVDSGQYDLYVPQTMYGNFRVGGDEKRMVASPGNAKNAITIGAYNFQSDWLAASGGHVHNMFEVGDLAEYSNAGYRRDDLVKPDIVAPGSFAISAYADGATAMTGNNRSNLLPGGNYVAWQGTSAATPYAAGVVALMLQKNPKLDAAQIQKILDSTAKKDKFTGSLPNRDWGHGKLNPAASLKATPAR